MIKTSSAKKHQTSSSRVNNVDNCKVVIRVRPLFPRCSQQKYLFYTTVVSQDQKAIMINQYFNYELIQPQQLQEYSQDPNNFNQYTFSFDRIYDQNSKQHQIYDTTAKQSVLSMLEGFNATIMAYGQTGTGKTFTMEGFKYNSTHPERGIIPRTIEQIFQYMQSNAAQTTKFLIRISYLQIYNQFISDLLCTKKTNLQIREDKKKGVYVDGLSEWVVKNPNQIFSCLTRGASNRKTAYTNMNDCSSRSHSVFIIIVQQANYNQKRPNQIKTTKFSKLNLVDLAGSERVRVTGATGTRLQQSKKINQSLSYLGNVVSALTAQKKQPFVNYRDTKITRILQDSLGGNCKTTMIVMISPALQAFSESLSSLKFANRAKKIRNSPKVNEDFDQKTLIRKYEIEVKKLRTQLQQKNRNQFDRTKVCQLEQEKRKIQHDKNKAIAALQQRNRALQRQRNEKKKLQQKIKDINSKMILGGNKIEETPQFQSALDRIRKEYEIQLKKIEQKQLFSQSNSEESKGLVFKQRDIMVVLTQKLNQRDGFINQLQDQLAICESLYREKQNTITLLQNELKKHNIPIPKDIIQKKQKVEYFEGHQIYNLNLNTLKQNAGLKDITNQRDQLQEKFEKQNQERKNVQNKLEQLTRFFDKFYKALTTKSGDKSNLAYELQKMKQILKK